MDEMNQAASPVEQQAPVEKTLTQSEVNQIVARRAQEVEAKTRERVMMEMQQAQQQQAQQQQQAPEQYQQRQASADELYQQVQERFNQEMQQRQQQEHMSAKANSYHSRLTEGSKAYNDFSDVTKSFDPTQFPELVYLLADLDGAADIVYELNKNPQKLVTLDALAKRAPQMALSELHKVQSAMAANKEAQADAPNNMTNAPLDHLQPSRVSGSTGPMSVRDFRNMPQYRG
jgi:hypothetical protein